MQITQFIQRKFERLLGRDVFAWTGKDRTPVTARFCKYGHAVFSGNNLCTYGHHAA
jgi:hypothetical protein